VTRARKADPIVMDDEALVKLVKKFAQAVSNATKHDKSGDLKHACIERSVAWELMSAIMSKAPTSDDINKVIPR
jgi:hypothetical protein